MIGEKEWLDSLKSGDKVAVCGTGTMRGKDVEVVSRVTPSQIILGDGIRCASNSGYRVGSSGSWSRSYLTKCTPQIEHEVFDRDTRAKIKRVDWNTVPLANILEILDKIP